MKRFGPVVLQENPQAVLVVGDVHSSAACALVAKKLGVFVIHVEAGLRSFDRSMPEEINRLVTDAISDLLLVTEESGMRNLQNEASAPDKIHLVGNLMIDSLLFNLERSRRSKILDELGLRDQPFGLVTLHRAANVDDHHHLQHLLGPFQAISTDLVLYFPRHPPPP